MLRTLKWLVPAAFLLGIVPASAQITAPVAKVPALTAGADIVLVAPGGNPNTVGQYAFVGQIGGVEMYQYSVPLTGFSITVLANTARVLINPAGTLATGTLLLPSLPIADGQHLCMTSTQTQTALTVTAATGTSIIGTAVSALVALTPVCWLYDSPLASWVRYQ